MTLSESSVRISHFLGSCLFLMVPLHHLGLLTLVLSGFLSHSTGVPTSNLGNSLVDVAFSLELTFVDQYLHWFIISQLTEINHGQVGPVFV